MGIVPFVMAFSAVYIWFARKIMQTDRRINNAEFVVLCLLLIPLMIALSQTIWAGWVEFRAGFGLRPFPEPAYALYSAEELSLSPVVFTILSYGAVTFLASLKNWPVELTPDEIKVWQKKRIRSSLWVSVPILVLDSAYVVYKWYPVWGQWFGLIQGVSA